MNMLPLHKRTAILKCLLDGNSLRATGRITGTAKQTVCRLFEDAAGVALREQDRLLRNIRCERLELDEIWSFVYAKAKTVRRRPVSSPDAGNVWTWIAFDPDTKLAPCWCIGDRTTRTAEQFIGDLRQRVNPDIQITTDGYAPYLWPVDYHFGGSADFAQLVKQYDERGHYAGAEKTIISGDPDMDKVSTSGVERFNLTLRMSARRFTRETNAYSKKLRNHELAVALMMLHYNFMRRHDTIGAVPGVAAGVIEAAWTVERLADMAVAVRPKPNRPKRYRKRAAVA
ncbi:MAG: IS1 family transposase [Gammaproteobacteria bacterium]|nr:IS1 family transposase [Gammaproteobacteria bacterium]